MELILHTEGQTTRDRLPQRKLCVNASLAKNGENFPLHVKFSSKYKGYNED
jgi:hypothetical protein